MQRQTLGEVQAELTASDHRLAQSGQQQSTIDHEVGLLQQRLAEVGEALSAEIHRLEEARRAGAAAEQHARDVRLRVQREAQRVAERAAAAVLAAAAGAGETGEFPQIVLDRGADGTDEGDERSPSRTRVGQRDRRSGRQWAAGSARTPADAGLRSSPTVGRPVRPAPANARRLSHRPSRRLPRTVAAAAARTLLAREQSHVGMSSLAGAAHRRTAAPLLAPILSYFYFVSAAEPISSATGLVPGWWHRRPALARPVSSPSCCRSRVSP